MHRSLKSYSIQHKWLQWMFYLVYNTLSNVLSQLRFLVIGHILANIWLFGLYCGQWYCWRHSNTFAVKLWSIEINWNCNLQIQHLSVLSADVSFQLPLTVFLCGWTLQMKQVNLILISRRLSFQLMLLNHPSLAEVSERRLSLWFYAWWNTLKDLAFTVFDSVVSVEMSVAPIVISEEMLTV